MSVQLSSSPATPHIGILCIDVASTFQEHFGATWHSFIAASYVKHLEGAGALVVPVWIGRERGYYQTMMEQLNGLLLPGGAVFVDPADMEKHPHLSSDCVPSVGHIYELALEMNEKGKHFPVWGTCLGFQLLLINAANSIEVRSSCQPMFKAQSLELSAEYRNSTLLKQLPAALAADMRTAPFACHQHRFCITEDNLLRFGLQSDWRVLATRTDAAGLRFITLLEHRRYPFFGCQFHPERAAFEQLFARPDCCAQSHTRVCIELAQFFANAFVESCRRNDNKFATVQLKRQHLIGNWQPTFTGALERSNWLQCYLFERNVQYPEATDEPEEVANGPESSSLVHN